jgi:cytochrome bd-type quinol oxidase subunit 2
MQNRTLHELLTAFQYLLIGLIALGVVQRWFSQRPQWMQMLVWTLIMGGVSLLRLFILALSEWVQGNRWQTIRRRNWD